MNTWNGLEEFMAIAEHGSISAAAQALNTPRTTVSRRLKELEESLGVELAFRTTRTLQLTRAGKLLRERGRVILDLGRAVREEVIQQDNEPRGTLRVSIPAGPNPWMIEACSAFLDRYPKARVEIFGTGRAVDLVREEFDVVLRAGQVHDDTLVGRKLAEIELICVATPEYVRQHGEPISASDLLEHESALWTDHEKTLRSSWPLKNTSQTVPVRGTFASNDPHHLLTYALTGRSLVLLPTPFAQPHLDSGTLQHILPDVIGTVSTVWILYVPTRYQLPIVRAFVDHICAYPRPLLIHSINA